MREYKKLVENSTYSHTALFVYDALWSLAFALNNTNNMINWPKEKIINDTNCEDDGKDLTIFNLTDFTYNHSFIGCVIRWNLAQTNFIGVSVSAESYLLSSSGLEQSLLWLKLVLHLHSIKILIY